ncbi:MAG: hypothetical protein QOJ29_1303 [Thermoleophilaceae bacterium]|nr:hypothetical protein [Thermoleophilaceae bacterium]
MADVDPLEGFDSRVSYVGPFQHHDVIVDGRAVPFLRATPLDGGQVHLTLDRRLGVTLSTDEAERVVPFLADTIAVALGYTAHPEAERDGPNVRHPFPRVSPLMTAD